MVLRGDQRGIRARQRLGPDVILPDPAQARAAERWLIESDQRLEPGVAGLGKQHGANAGRDVADPRAALACVGEPVRKAGARVHLQQQFRQVHPR